MKFPPIYVIWVTRDGRPFYVGTAQDYSTAVRIGEETVSTRDYVVSKYVEEVVDSECCGAGCDKQVCETITSTPAIPESEDINLPLDIDPGMDHLFPE